MPDAVSAAPQEAAPVAPPKVAAVHVGDTPVLFRDFVATIHGTEEWIFAKVMKVAHQHRACTMAEWRQRLDAAKSAPLPPTNHGIVVSPRGRRR